MKIIPLRAGKNQTMTIVLSAQQCRLTVRENSTGTYFDLYVNNEVVQTSVLCLDRVQMITAEYLGFIGRFMFIDTQGVSDPVASGFGGRYQLQYLEPGIDY